MKTEQMGKTPLDKVNMKKVLRGMRYEGGFNWLRLDASE
jgi:hypothetical protein